MAPLPPIASILKCAIGGTCDTYNWLNVLHFQYSGPEPGVSGCQAIANQIATEWSADITPLQDTHTILDQVEVTDLTSATAGEFILTGIGEVGTEAGAFLPADAAALVTYPVSVRYRGGHPRTYLCVGTQPDLTDRAHWTGSFVAVLGDAWGLFQAAMIGFAVAGTTITAQGAVSYIDKIANPVPPYRRAAPLFYPFVPANFAVKAELAAQRRRIGRK